MPPIKPESERAGIASSRVHAYHALKGVPVLTERELYQKKMRAKLDEIKADVDRLKVKASETGADARIHLNRQIRELDGRIEEGKMKLAALASAGEDTWILIKKGIESSWDSMKSAVDDVMTGFKH
jgi:hypothetical protein